ncbi:MAG TPA: 8-amino-7-oxononanoate synthase [Polyangia bacterium]|nr:8-amino-7-oxononanoate synthase [Polyangia bacterium]
MRDLSAILEAELADLGARGRLRACPPLAGSSRVRPLAESRPLLSFSSNDYLGLASHPGLLAAAQSSATSEGFGAGAARLVTGNLPAHRQLEATIATALRRPAALAFPSGYQANIGAITALAGPPDLVVSDAANHASLIDGCRLSRARIAVYPHADVTSAAAALSQSGSFRRRLLVTESLFSMDGDAAPLRALADLAAQHDAILLVDEAHALGVLGPNGRGLAAAVGVDPDVLLGTLGKAFGAAGGFVTGSIALRDYLVNRARTFIFTTAPPAPIAAAATAGLQLAFGPEGDQRRARLHVNKLRLLERLTGRISPFPGAIVPIILGSDAAALGAASALRARHLFVPPIRPPTVPEGSARLRVTLSSDHTTADIDELADALLEILP